MFVVERTLSVFVRSPLSRQIDLGFKKTYCTGTHLLTRLLVGNVRNASTFNNAFHSTKTRLMTTGDDTETETVTKFFETFVDPMRDWYSQYSMQVEYNLPRRPSRSRPAPFGRKNENNGPNRPGHDPDTLCESEIIRYCFCT